MLHNREPNAIGEIEIIYIFYVEPRGGKCLGNLTFAGRLDFLHVRQIT